MADIKKPMSPPVMTAPAPARGRMIAAVAAVGLGLLAAMAGWIYFSSGNDTAAALSVASAPPEAMTPRIVATASAVPVAVPVEARAPQPPQPPQAPQALRAPQAPRSRQAARAPEYVGTLSIDSSPGGTVFVNRRSAGRTPLRLSELRAGSHLIWIEREGYRRWTRVVHVPADRISRVSAELEPIAAR